ncbi:ABC transporter substrate-binding protein [bacterium 1XD42-8]|jgi:peptide/nickel transport system substrate-binding protein|nr:ABC transporter substrate-binding protein [Lachnospiraceae bacterium]RKJ51361.1 ABC transporter substrate-binding protein [bacterium 1XD42-8]
MRKKGNILLVSVLTTLTIALSGCSGDKAGGSSGIVVGIPQDLEDSLDPHKAVAAGTKEVLFNVFEGLVKPDQEGNLVPAVAKEYHISEDGKTYIFSLREGITFHNGNPVTVEDVIYSIEKCADTENGGPLVSAYSILEGVKAVDEHTVEIYLKEPDTEFLAYMTTAIVPKGQEDIDTNPIGTGPFTYVSRSPQENIIMERYDGYWGEKAKIEKVTFKIVANPDTVVLELESGAMDLYPRITAPQAEELSDQFYIEEGTSNLVQALYLNHDRAPFDNKMVRQAMCYAVDKKELLELTAKGKGTIIGSSMFPTFQKYFIEELGDYYPTDIEKAKALLKEAGYEDGFSFTITVPSNYRYHVETAQVLIEQLKRIGITGEIQLIEWDSWLSDVYAGGNFDATVIGVDASSLTARALLERFTTEGDGNFIHYSNEEYDALFKEARACTDDEQQVEIYKKMEKILTEDAANIYIQDTAQLVAVHQNLGGYAFYPLYVQDMSLIYEKDGEE